MCGAPLQKLAQKHCRVPECVVKFDKTLMVVVLSFCVALGCGGSADRDRTPTDAEKNLLALGTAIAHYTSKNARPPADLTQVKTWLKSVDAKKLQDWGITDVEKIFVSPRDNQPYLYAKPAELQSPIYAYETTGVGGKKQMVGFALHVDEVSEDQLQYNLNAAKVKTPIE
jgi:hypothetical protein